MSETWVTSKENPLIKNIRLIARGSRRAPPDLILAEGIKVLEEATRSHHEIDAVLLSDGFGTSDKENALLAIWARKKIRICRAATKFLKQFSDMSSPTSCIGLVRVPGMDLSEVNLPPDPLILCASAIQDPGNLGSLIRTAGAVETSAVCTTIGTVSARNPKAIRASAGSFFHIPVIENLKAQELLDFCGDRGIRLYGTSPQRGTPFWNIDFSPPCTILLGNEGQGLQESDWSSLPTILVPMADTAESLNVAAAGAVILFEAFRQRQFASPN